MTRNGQRLLMLIDDEPAQRRLVAAIAARRGWRTIFAGDPETAIAMLRSVSDAMVKHHQIIVLDEALDAAVKLSQRYIPSRQLPDKAVSLLDTACARVGVSQHATPAPV